MRMPRFRIRTMMILVAVVAFMVWGGTEAQKLYRLSRYYRAKAAEMRAQEIASSKQWAKIKQWPKRAANTELQLKKLQLAASKQPRDTGESKKRFQELMTPKKRSTQPRFVLLPVPEYFASLRLKYEHAASHPWESVPPDPPRPMWR